MQVSTHRDSEVDNVYSTAPKNCSDLKQILICSKAMSRDRHRGKTGSQLPESNTAVWYYTDLDSLNLIQQLFGRLNKKIQCSLI